MYVRMMTYECSWGFVGTEPTIRYVQGVAIQDTDHRLVSGNGCKVGGQLPLQIFDLKSHKLTARIARVNAPLNASQVGNYIQPLWEEVKPSTEGKNIGFDFQNSTLPSSTEAPNRSFYRHCALELLRKSR